MEEQNRDKPGMGCPTRTPNDPLTALGQPGASPRGPRRPAPYPLPTKIDIRLTDTLRTALRKRALADGITDSACARRILLDALDVESDLDRRIGAVVTDAFPFAGHRCERLTAAVLARLAMK